MNALWLEDGRVTHRRDVPAPEAPPGEAVVRVTCAGVCSTDLELVRGYYPFRGVLGHEFVGVVERGGGDLDGQRVVGEINAVCRRCPACLAGRSNHCPHRTVLGIVGRDGAFAERLVLPRENLHAVPDHVPDDAAVFTEPLAAALRITEQTSVRGADRVLVLGAGRLGQLIARTLRRTGCELQVAARHHGQRERLSAHGIRAVDPDDVPPAAFDAVVECTGSAAAFPLARAAVRPSGTLVMKSTYASDLTLDASSLVVDEITLIGSRCGPFGPALALLADGEVDPTDMIEGRLPLIEGETALAAAARPGALKILLHPG